VTQEDPGVPLPLPWIRRYSTFDYLQEMEAVNEDDMTCIWYDNVVTREQTNWDPRLTPAALRDRGVNNQEFMLI